MDWKSISLLALSASLAGAASNVDPAHALIESAFIGQIDWRPSAEFGAAINQYYASGALYGAQVGWIRLGSGAPLDGIRHQNDSADDFGVNVLPTGALRGFAYGANIGWIAFNAQGNPRVDWTTGQLHGSIYSANCGWISLEVLGRSVRLESIGPAPDTDGDGLPDPWEIARTGTLTKFSATSDSDGDGQTDREEYLAGTDPLDAADRLGPIDLTIDATGAMAVHWPTKPGYVYLLEGRVSLQPEVHWETLTGAPVVGNGSAVAFPLSSAPSSSAFFRVRAFPPLTRVNGS